MKLIVVGDSHTTALRRAFKSMKRDGALPPDIKVGARKLFAAGSALVPFFEETGTAVRLLDGAAGERLEAVLGAPEFTARDDTVYALSLGFMTQVIVGAWDWETHAVWWSTGPGGKVSGNVVRAMALDSQTHVLAFYAALGRIGARVLAVESPPPAHDDPITSPHLAPDQALHVDALMRAAMRQALSELGVPVVGVPAGVRREDGFRDPKFRSFKSAGTSGGEDRIQVDADFGVLQIPELLATARTLMAAPAGGFGVAGASL